MYLAIFNFKKNEICWDVGIISDSDAKKLLTEIVEYGKYSYEQETKREDSLISQAGHMATVFSFSTAALYILFQIALEHYKSLSPLFLVLVVAPITVLLLLSLLFSILATWRWKQDTFYSAGELSNFVMKNEDHYLKQDYAFLSEWHKVLTYKQERLYKLNNRRSKLVKASMWSFIIALCLVFVFGTMALIGIKEGVYDMENNNTNQIEQTTPPVESAEPTSSINAVSKSNNTGVLAAALAGPTLGPKPTLNFTKNPPNKENNSSNKTETQSIQNEEG